MDKAFVKLATGQEVVLSDRRILRLRPDDVLHPVHGWPVFIVEDIEGGFIGWATPEDVTPYASVLEWMKATHYVIRCKCDLCLRMRKREGLP